MCHEPQKSCVKAQIAIFTFWLAVSLFSDFKLSCLLALASHLPRSHSSCLTLSKRAKKHIFFKNVKLFLHLLPQQPLLLWRDFEPWLKEFVSDLPQEHKWGQAMLLGDMVWLAADLLIHHSCKGFLRSGLRKPVRFSTPTSPKIFLWLFDYAWSFYHVKKGKCLSHTAATKFTPIKWLYAVVVLRLHLNYGPKRKIEKCEKCTFLS